MRFAELLQALKVSHTDSGVLAGPTADAAITAPVVEDDRLCKPGGVFVARKGASLDGHDRIQAAVAAGAAAVIGERPPGQIAVKVPYAQVPNAQMALGYLAAAWEGHPSRKLFVIGVTGTDGKTTTTTLIYHILKTAGVRVGMISTVNAVIGDEALETGLHVTTPGAPDTQHYLRRMVDAGLTHCILETTSHGLAQGRVNGVQYDVAVLTNITHEHLDFHGTWENYRDAKAQLFRMTSATRRKAAFGMEKAFVINADDPSAGFFAAFGQPNATVYFSLRPDQKPVHTPAFIAEAITHTPVDTRVTVRYTKRDNMRLYFRTQLIGDYNVANIMAAISAVMPVLFTGDWKKFNAQVQAGLDALPPIPGRMERIDAGQDYTAIVDFAHTPNALERALEAARTLVPAGRRLIVVFGCAGLRDREKRQLMPAISIRLADVSIFTAEDPRTESLTDILETMARSAVAAGGVEKATFWRIPDRGQALALACTLARPGDVVIACGKGHEQSMAFGLVEYPWNDRDALRGAIRGIPPRTLPTAEQN
jgi:UDP-N-acetylmuramoyl-L-alanyl-D-glutamate--2,6-diaminopimelate ligase